MTTIKLTDTEAICLSVFLSVHARAIKKFALKAKSGPLVAEADMRFAETLSAIADRIDKSASRPCAVIPLRKGGAL